MIFDAHAHYPAVIEVSVDPGTPMKTIDEEMNFLKMRGVDRCVMFAPLGGWENENLLLKQAAEKYAGRIIPFCSVNPTYGEAASAKVRECVGEWGFKGVKLHPQAHQYLADSPSVISLLETIAKFKIPVTFHTGDLFIGEPYARPRRFIKIAETFPDVKMIMAHMGSLDWPEMVEIAAKYDNMIMDTTGSTVTYGFIETFVERIGPERIVWGSDVPCLDPVMAISKIKDSEISDEAKRLILGENIARILGVK